MPRKPVPAIPEVPTSKAAPGPVEPGPRAALERPEFSGGDLVESWERAEPAHAAHAEPEGTPQALPQGMKLGRLDGRRERVLADLPGKAVLSPSLLCPLRAIGAELARLRERTRVAGCTGPLPVAHLLQRTRKAELVTG